MKRRGVPAMMNEVLASVLERDRIDSTRDVAPLTVAADAVLIDSDQLTAEQTFEEVKKLCE
jgi:cytidylate kinase